MALFPKERDDPRILTDNKINENASINRSVFSRDKYEKATSNMFLFANGNPIKVQYYSSINLDGNTDSNDSDLFSESNRSKLRKVNDLILKVENDFEFQLNPEESNSSLTGEASLYLNFDIKIGDFFIYEMNDKSYGIFVITGKSIGTHLQTRFYTITFKLRDILTNDILNKINNKVEKIDIYNIENINKGESITIVQNEYNQVKIMETYKRNILKHYLNLYYVSGNLNNIYKENMFDPYVVSFINHFIDFKETNKIFSVEKNLICDFDESIFGILINKDRIDIDYVKKRINNGNVNYTEYDLGITPLHNKKVLKLSDNENNDLYIFSKEFYNQDRIKVKQDVIDALDDSSDILQVNQQIKDVAIESEKITDVEYNVSDEFENLILNYINDRKLDNIDNFINDHLKIYKLNNANTKVDTFYKLPLYMFLISRTIEDLKRGKY